MAASAPSASLRVPIQARSQRTRASVVAGARAEFSERGYTATTARSIAARAGVGTGTFYHYFPDKDAVLREITQERVSALLHQAEVLVDVPPNVSDERSLVRGALDRLTTLVHLYVDVHREEAGLHAVITERRLCDPALDAIMSEAEREAVRRSASALSHWGYDGDAESAAYMMFSLLEGAVHAHVLGQPVVSDTRFHAALVEALLRIALPSALLPHSLSASKERNTHG